MTLLNSLVLIGLCLIKVSCISLKGPGTTWYNPCGLGVIHFDKYSKHNWLGVVHFGLYKHLQVAVIEIKFDKKVRIYWASHNSTVTPMDDQGREYFISPEGFVPEQYKFYFELERSAENDTDVPRVVKFTLNNLILCDDNIRVSQTVESLSMFNRYVCGRRSLKHSELVSIRTDARPGNWPWQVAVLTRNSTTNKTSHYCGGNIISRTAVLTAGPCIRRNGKTIPKEWITVVAGIVNLQDSGQIGQQSLPVTDVVLHPNYHDDLATSAIAVLKVERFIFTAYVQPVCIWGPVYEKASLFGKLGMFVGFGDNEKNNPSYALRSTDILIQNDTTCLMHSPDLYGKLINEFTICAGTSTGLRPGDGGGGLILPVMQSDHKMSWFLRGILSKCILTADQSECDPDFYVVYTDVGPHFAWIYHHSGLQ